MIQQVFYQVLLWLQETKFSSSNFSWSVFLLKQVISLSHFSKVTLLSLNFRSSAHKKSHILYMLYSTTYVMNICTNTNKRKSFCNNLYYYTTVIQCEWYLWVYCKFILQKQDTYKKLSSRIHLICNVKGLINL